MDAGKQHHRSLGIDVRVSMDERADVDGIGYGRVIGEEIRV